MAKWFRQLYWRWKRGQLSRPGRCFRCEKICWLVYTPAMTMYEQKPGELDPNYVGFLCRKCSEDYRLYWKEMWDEYNYGRL